MLKNMMQLASASLEELGKRAGVATRDDRGAMSTEWAVVTFLVLAIAVVVAGILLAKATSQANSVPDNVSVG